MLAAMIACLALVMATIIVHYEALRLTSVHLRDLPIPPRFRILGVVIAAFAAHTVEVWLYAIAYWALTDRFGFGGLHAPDGVIGFEECLYFSAVTFSTAGFGDLYPIGHLRLLAGVEGLNGLLLVGWSASFTYLAMEEYWPSHRRRRREARKS